MTDINAVQNAAEEVVLRRELELAKIQNDLEIKRRELNLAERKIALEEKTLQGKGVSELKTGFISVITAIVAAFGTFIAAYYGGFFDVEKTNATSKASFDLTKLQFSNELVKNALSSNNPANSLLFYADVGLLEGLKADSVKNYAEEEKKRIKTGEQGPSLLPSFANASVSNASTWLNSETLRAIAPDANPEIVLSLTTIGNYLLTGFEINKNTKRLSMFIGQVAHETGGLKILVENGNYSEDSLLRTFPEKFNKQEALSYANKPEQILNRVYANRMGNGPESSGDGWRYRGRGYLQIAGKHNYIKMTKETGINLYENPDLASDPNVGLLIAAAYWYNSKLNSMSDEQKVDQVTRRLIGGLEGFYSRKRYTDLALNVLQKGVPSQ